MHSQITTLTQASIHQLREGIHRVTALHEQASEQRDEQELLSGVDVIDSTWDEWEETMADIRQLHD